MTTIQEMKPSDISIVAKMAQELFKENDFAALEKEFECLSGSQKDTILVAIENRDTAGFIHMSLRYEYVEGATSTPVAYIEGIYVKPDYRQRHIAHKLISAGEGWAKSKGCTQIASDVEMDNAISQKVHQKTGFKEVNRLVCYVKSIEL